MTTQPGSNNAFLKALDKEAQAKAHEAPAALAEKLADPKPLPSVEKPDENQSVAQARPQNAPPPRNSMYRWSSGRRRLEVNAIPGYRLYWHKTSDIADAIAGGWEFVHKEEVSLNSTSIGGDVEQDKGTDLGSRVSIMGSPGAQERLYLMKLHQEYAAEYQRDRMRANVEPLRSIFIGEKILDPNQEASAPGLSGPGPLTYVKTKYTPLFQRGPKTAPQVTGAVVR